MSALVSNERKGQGRSIFSNNEKPFKYTSELKIGSRFDATCEAVSFPRGDEFEEGSAFRPLSLGDVAGCDCVFFSSHTSSPSSRVRCNDTLGVLPMPSEFFVVLALDFLGLVRTHSRAAKLERKDDIP